MKKQSGRQADTVKPRRLEKEATGVKAKRERERGGGLNDG